MDFCPLNQIIKAITGYSYLDENPCITATNTLNSYKNSSGEVGGSIFMEGIQTSENISFLIKYPKTALILGTVCVVSMGTIWVVHHLVAHLDQRFQSPPTTL